MQKRFSGMSAMLFALLAITGCVYYEPVGTTSEMPIVSYFETVYIETEISEPQGRACWVEALRFYSLEEFLYALAATREGRPFLDADRSWIMEIKGEPGFDEAYRVLIEDVAEIAANIGFSSMDRLYLPTNIPETFQLADIMVFDDTINILYTAISENDTDELQGMSMPPHFHLSVTRWTHENLAEWEDTSPLSGIMRQYAFAEEDLIGGRYYFREWSNTLYWEQGPNRFALQLPRVPHENNIVRGFSAEDLGLADDSTVPDILQFSETITIDLQDEANIAAWSAGDFSMLEDVLR